MKFFTEKTGSPSKKKELDVKGLLKQARQYIDNNNFKKAQQLCKRILRQDTENYMALVLLGKSYGKSEEALKLYEKAIELKPDNILAWQGLAVYYEGREEASAKTKLLSVYDKILNFETIQQEYGIKIQIKTGQLAYQLKDNNAISTFIRVTKIQDNKIMCKMAKMQIVHLLKTSMTCKDEDVTDVIRILKSLEMTDLSKNHTELIILGDIIFHNMSFIGAVEEVIGLKLFSKSLIMKTWLCMLLCRIYVRQKSYFCIEIEKYISRIVAGIENTTYATILQAICYYRQSRFEIAYQMCLRVTKERLNFIQEIEALFLLDCSHMSKNLLRTKNLCYYLIKKTQLKDPNFLEKVNITLLSCFIEDKKLIKSLYHLLNIPINKMDAVVLTEFGDFFIGSEVIDDRTWEILDSTDYLDLFRAWEYIRKDEFAKAVEVLELYEKHPIKFFYLGLSYYFMGKEDESFANFLTAAELTPHYYRVHYFLGVHYFSLHDFLKSKTYFEKAREFCKTDLCLIRKLGVVYAKLDLADLERDMLQKAFKTLGIREYWLCSRLGRLCLTKGVIDEALFYFWAALDIHPRDVIIHELIGDIYYNKRDYGPAFIAYNTVVQLSHDNVVFFKCLNRIGSIFSEKMLYHKAIFIFDNILDVDPGNVTALKGLAENRTILALKLVANNLYRDARMQMQYILNRIITSMSKGIKDLVYWLLYGDVLVFMIRLPNKYSFVTLQTADREITKERVDLYHMAINNYSNIIKFRDSSALFRCSVVYFEYYCETRNIILCKTSYNLAVLYMKANPNIWPIWDLLGKLCYHLGKCETAYYCFSKALSLCEDSHLTSWYDIGTFYLKLDKHQLRNYRYASERIDLSTFTPTWITEGISDTRFENSEMYDPNLSKVEDMDEFQFTELIPTIHPSSAQSKEPTFDSPIESLKIVPNATDIIEWYLCFEEETTWSLCSLGNLQETKGLFTSALRYYDRAYRIAHYQLKNKMLSHKGRVLMKMQEYEEAVNVYIEMREKNFHDTCTLASALYKMDSYKKSYASYNKALNDLCENDEQRVDVLVAMANVEYRLNGISNAMKLLCKALRIKCGKDTDFNLEFLISYVFQKADIQLVAHVMSAYFYKDIDETLWWYYMGLNYLRGLNKYAKISRACIKRAIRINTDSERLGKLYAIISTAEFYAGNRQRALQCSTEALQLYPMQPELWAMFILCVYADQTWPHKAAFLRVVIAIVRKITNVSEYLDKFLTKVEEDSVDFPKYFNFSNNSNFNPLYS